jgi:hypothetical protein
MCLLCRCIKSNIRIVLFTSIFKIEKLLFMRSIVSGSILIIKLLLQTMNIKEKFRFKVKVLLEQKLIICLIILAKSHLVI